MEKRIELNSNRVLIYETSEESVFVNRLITEGFMLNNDVIKDYTFEQTDDFLFSASSKNIQNINELVFEFGTDHPLYIPFKNLLSNDEELIIDDDLTRYDGKKYLKIIKCRKRIYLAFINDLKDSKYDSEKFNIFVKNVLYDKRSKIDEQGKDTKKRLHRFFYEADKVLKGEYQMTLEDAIENQKSLIKK